MDPFGIWKFGDVEIWKYPPDYPIRFPNSHISKFPNPLASTDKIDDLYLVAVLDGRRRVRVAFDHDEVALDGHAARVDIEARQKRRDRRAARQLVGVAVERDGQRLPSPRLRRPRT